MGFTYSLDLHFHASHIDANHIDASTYENHIRAFRRPEGQAIPISDALSFILHRVTDSNILKSRGQAIMQVQKGAFQHFNIAFLGCLQFQSYEKKPYPKASFEFKFLVNIKDLTKNRYAQNETNTGKSSVYLQNVREKLSLQSKT